MVVSHGQYTRQRRLSTSMILLILLSRKSTVQTDAFRPISSPFHHRSTKGSVLYSENQDTSISSYYPSARSQQSQTDEHRLARRWNGNYKHSSTKLCDVSKAKKLQLELSVCHADGSTTTKTVVKKRQETLQHVLTKAILWKLFCDEYPGMEIEQDIGDPDFLPDVISLDQKGNPLFWGESGRMKVHKAIDLMRRYPNCHIVHCRWDMSIDAIAAPLLEELQQLFDTDCLGDLPARSGKFTFYSLPLDVWQFIDEETGMIHVVSDDLLWKELQFPTTKSKFHPPLALEQGDELAQKK